MTVTVNDASVGAVITVVVKINATIPNDTQFLVVGKGDYSLASAFDGDIDAIHASSLPNLDPDVPTSPTMLNYFILRDVDSGETRVLASEWLETLTVSNTKNYHLVMTNISIEEYSGVIKILNNYGLKGRFKLEAEHTR